MNSFACIKESCFQDKFVAECLQLKFQYLLIAHTLQILVILLHAKLHYACKFFQRQIKLNETKDRLSNPYRTLCAIIINIHRNIFNLENKSFKSSKARKTETIMHCLCSTNLVVIRKFEAIQIRFYYLVCSECVAIIFHRN